MILLGCFLAGITGWWAWRLAGNVAAVVAVCALCFDPNFLAHAPLVKNDVATALVLMLLMAGVWLLGEKATIFRFVAVALMSAAAIDIKFSGILAVPMVGLVLLFRAVMKKPWQCFGRWLPSRPARKLRRHRCDMPFARDVGVGLGLLSLSILADAGDRSAFWIDGYSQDAGQRRLDRGTRRPNTAAGQR